MLKFRPLGHEADGDHHLTAGLTSEQAFNCFFAACRACSGVGGAAGGAGDLARMTTTTVDSLRSSAGVTTGVTTAAVPPTTLPTHLVAAAGGASLESTLSFRYPHGFGSPTASEASAAASMAGRHFSYPDGSRMVLPIAVALAAANAEERGRYGREGV